MMNEGENRGCLCLGTGPQASELFRKLIPESTREHFRNSRIEFLKAVRSLIDQRIDHLSRSEKKGTTVTVE